MACGVALCVRSNLGSSVIATIPFVMTLAGEAGMAPQFTIGEHPFYRTSDSHPPPRFPTDATFPIHYWFCIRFPIRC